MWKRLAAIAALAIAPCAIAQVPSSPAPLTLDEAVSRTATLAAEMQRELRLRFGADIDDARQHVLTAEV